MTLPGIGSHHSARSQTDDWLTPPALLNALGWFDLDPCMSLAQEWQTAREGFTIEDDGLSMPWRGRVWLNPPYSNVGPWMRKMRAHGRGTALVFARTETAWWFDSVWPHATAILFLRSRVTFLRPDGSHQRANGGTDGGNGNAGAPSALVAYGVDDAAGLSASGLAGALVTGAEMLYNSRRLAPSPPAEAS